MDVAPADMFAERLQPLLHRLAAQAHTVDRDAQPPDDFVASLHAAAALVAPAPRALGGYGLGTEPEGAALAFRVLWHFGRASMPAARLFEGHLNALRLILLYGEAAQAEAACADAAAGHLFAVWAAESPADPVRLIEATVVGQKTFASGAGLATRALITAATPAGEQLVLVALPAGDARVAASPDLLGMRGAATAGIDLTGLDATPVGRAGDYMRQPEISLGAWRPLAALAGGLQALAEAVRAVFVRRNGVPPPLQAARLAELAEAAETARLWADRAGLLAETQGDEDAAAYVKLARLAVDAACVRAVALAQRAVGLAGCVRPHPVERLCRDLATYMRQPALDEVALEAAAHVREDGLPT